MSSNQQLINSVIESPILLVVIIPIFLLFFLFKMLFISIPDAVNDLKKSDDKDRLVTKKEI
jgi:hypothetical protein